MNSFDEIEPDMRLDGVAVGSTVEVVALQPAGPTSATIVYRSTNGDLGQRVLTTADLQNVRQVTARRWTFDADPELFKLAAEARRMKWAHLSDPFAAVDTSNIEPYPHQIDAVYNRFLEQRPLRFLLADDPGAGKTIMAGLLVRELMLRGDVARCLVLAPGSLVEQWQDELWEKFSLEFDILTRVGIEASRTGNPFLERNLLIARIHQISRDEDLIGKLKASDWDLVIVDEAHKMSAHRYGRELKKTKLFALGEVVRDHTRHLLLMTATPHNGKNEDFLAFMTLLDPARFAGSLRNSKVPDVSDVMRRLVKENLHTFDGKRLFPRRYAHSLPVELSDPEMELYERVTSYVRTGMNRAAKLSEEGDKRRGTIVGFALAGLQRRLASSPDAIYHSLRRRRERLREQAALLREIAETGTVASPTQLPKGVRIEDLALEDFDWDEWDDEELEQLEDITIDSATAALSADEIDLEVTELGELVDLAQKVRTIGVDGKWLALRSFLRTDEFRDPDGGPRKLIIFSEHKDTLSYVADRVANELGRPHAVVTIHGGIKREDRREIQEQFRNDPTVEVLVATDAAGEGVNLQVANMMVNYDLPWNPNRIEQRFGRIHRIGQKRPCHLFNLVAAATREGQVFTRLFEKIRQQAETYGDQVYDVLGDSLINRSLQELLLDAILKDQDPAHAKYMDEVIDGEIGPQLTKVLEERALDPGMAGLEDIEEIREAMERSRIRKLQPWFVETFFTRALRQYGGHIVGREHGRHEITRIPAKVRSHDDPSLGSTQERYARVTFDKQYISTDDHPDRAVLVSPGTPPMTAVVAKVLADHGATLDAGTTLVAPDDHRTEPRLLVFLNHAITDGLEDDGRRRVVSRRFQYVEIDSHGEVTDPGPQPYANYDPITDEQRSLVADSLNLDWADASAETRAREWAIEHLAQPHFEERSTVTRARVAKVRKAVKERLVSEIRYWDRRAAHLKAREEETGRNWNSAQAARRADELEARLDRRERELDREADLHSNPPNIVGAALVIPQGLLDALAGHPPDPGDVATKMETDRRAVAAVMEAERRLGRLPEEMTHTNPGYDIHSIDPETGIHYYIEVKGHLPDTTEIHVSHTQVTEAKTNPERWRLAIASVPAEHRLAPTVRYLSRPFENYDLHFAQTSVPLNVAQILQVAEEPH